jgi:2-hydroxy-3-oxopropionate reductase
MPEQRIGLIGLGSMGRGIGKSLLRNSFPLTVYDANLAAIEPLHVLGAEGADTPKAVAERSDVVITVLPNGPDVEAVALGPNGIAEGAKPGTIVMDCSTIDPAASVAINRALRERGIRMVDTSMGRGPR